MKYLKTISLLIISLLSVFYLLSCSQKDNILTFDVNEYAVETKIVHSSAGVIEVKYHAYMHIPYVAKPVDTNYQSLNVFVPVQVNGKKIDATNAPIFLKIAVGGYMPVDNSKDKTIGNESGNSREDLALAAGIVVVAPGCRGRSNQAANGGYYGKAPAAIVDLKAAVRYLKYNKDIIPGNVEQIISDGCSAGGALSALLGASGNSSLYEPYLNDMGAANTSDNIFASACYSPITDLEHSDMAYEWMYGNIPVRGELVDQDLSAMLIEEYETYQAFLEIHGKDGYGILTADNYKDYLLKYYLIPSAEKYLIELSENERMEYLNSNSWMQMKNNKLLFDFDDYASHAGRMKDLPAFDDFDMRSPETILFGNDSVNARHYTNFSLRHTLSNREVEIDDNLKQVVEMMNALYFVLQDNAGCANNWWLRNGTSDNHTSQTVMINLAAALENKDKSVNTWLFWDGGHCADYDADGLIDWILKICNY